MRRVPVSARGSPAERGRNQREDSSEVIFDSGWAVIGRTQIRGEQCLKLTLLNPMLQEEKLKELIEEIERAGEAIEAESSKLRAKAGTAE